MALGLEERQERLADLSAGLVRARGVGQCALGTCTRGDVLGNGMATGGVNGHWMRCRDERRALIPPMPMVALMVGSLRRPVPTQPRAPCKDGCRSTASRKRGGWREGTASRTLSVPAATHPDRSSQAGGTALAGSPRGATGAASAASIPGPSGARVAGGRQHDPKCWSQKTGWYKHTQRPPPNPPWPVTSLVHSLPTRRVVVSLCITWPRPPPHRLPKPSNPPPDGPNPLTQHSTAPPRHIYIGAKDALLCWSAARFQCKRN